MTKDDILLVDDDTGSIQLMARILGNIGMLRFATNGADGLRLAHESTPDLILLDTEMPGMSGFETCRALKADPALTDTPVIFVTSHSEDAFEVSGLDLGAADFIAKPVSAPLLLARVKTQLRVKHMSDELRRIATIDPLTGVANRRRFDESLEREWRRGQRANEPLALLMIDVDHFKLFNDRYGHPMGDACLCFVAKALGRTTLRPGDLVARYGGEEFAVLLPQTSRGGAEHVARGILDAVTALAIAHDASLTAPYVTVSVGIGCYDEESERPIPGPRIGKDLRAHRLAVDLLNAADRALYCAKRAGRAQAWLLDLAHVDNPELARDIAPPPLPRPYPTQRSASAAAEALIAPEPGEH
jgi:diguanylate cyclase (GGDEF)-like protein